MNIEIVLNNKIDKVPNYKLGLFLIKVAIKLMGNGKIKRIHGDI
jgi:hypothetical protein